MRLANAETRTNLEGLLILVVDDERDARERIGLMLEQAGACVTTMASAHKALEALRRMRPHVLIIDIGLPNEDAEELILKARALFEESGEQIPVVALESHAGSDDGQATFSADLRISKLTGANQLADAVARLTGRIEVSSCVLESATQ
jgi:CheY-like chemotaxis protein